MRRALLIVLAAALVGGGSGCGGQGAPARRAGPAPGAKPSVTQLRHGRAVFARSCSACHGLTGQEDPRRQGGDLAKFTMTEDQLVSETRVMPARRPLTEADVRAVSRYVLAVQRAYAARHPPGR